MTRFGQTTRRILAGGAALALAVTLSACAANDDLADSYREGSNQGFVSAGFEIKEFAPEERGEPIVFAGELDTGDQVSSDDFAGEVLVVNFWYAACGPCIAEAPVLEQVWTDHQDEDVHFLGVNIYDQAPTALSFARDNGVSYPSVIDIFDKAVSLAFAEATPLQAPPTTLVLDRQGRVAARIIGQLKDESILSTLIDDAVAESA